MPLSKPLSEPLSEPLSVQQPLRFALIGNGAIADALRELAAERPELALVGIVPREGSADPVGAPRLSREQAIAAADVIVEAAGVAAVAEHGPAIIAAGGTLLLASVGAFAAPELRASVLDAGPGTALLSTGAIGGLDVLAAAGATGGLDRVELRTTKAPGALVQPGTAPAERARLLGLSEPTEIFCGTAADAIAAFPASLNVAVAVGLATGLSERLVVRLVADPECGRTEHEVRAAGAAGEYRVTLRNEPLAAHPSSSGLTARSLLSGLLRLAGAGSRFV